MNDSEKQFGIRHLALSSILTAVFCILVFIGSNTIDQPIVIPNGYWSEDVLEASYKHGVTVGMQTAIKYPDSVLGGGIPYMARTQDEAWINFKRDYLRE